MTHHIALVALIALAGGCAAKDSIGPIMLPDGSVDGAVGGGQAGDDDPHASLLDDPLYDGGTLEDGQVAVEQDGGGDAGRVDTDAEVMVDADAGADAALEDAGPELNACGGTGTLTLRTGSLPFSTLEPGENCACGFGCPAQPGQPQTLVCTATPGNELHCQACKCGA
jgi:hypothetical protein